MTKQDELKPCAYWVRYDDGSGVIYEDKGEADNYAERSYTTPEVIPLYTRTPPSSEALEALTEIEYSINMLLKEAGREWSDKTKAMMKTIKTALSRPQIDWEGVKNEALGKLDVPELYTDRQQHIKSVCATIDHLKKIMEEPQNEE